MTLRYVLGSSIIYCVQMGKRGGEEEKGWEYTPLFGFFFFPAVKAWKHGTNVKAWNYHVLYLWIVTHPLWLAVWSMSVKWNHWCGKWQHCILWELKKQIILHSYFWFLLNFLLKSWFGFSQFKWCKRVEHSFPSILPIGDVGTCHIIKF